MFSPKEMPTHDSRVTSDTLKDGKLSVDEVVKVSQRIRGLVVKIAQSKVMAHKMAWAYFNKQQQQVDPVDLRDLLFSRKRSQHLRIINQHAIDNDEEMYLFKHKWLLTGYVEEFFYRYEARGRSDNLRWSVRTEIVTEESLP